MSGGMPYRVIESTKRGSRVITCVVGGVAVGDCFYCQFFMLMCGRGVDMKKSLICNDEAFGPISC